MTGPNGVEGTGWHEHILVMHTVHLSRSACPAATGELARAHAVPATSASVLLHDDAVTGTQAPNSTRSCVKMVFVHIWRQCCGLGICQCDVAYTVFDHRVLGTGFRKVPDAGNV
eukprot:4711255-Amphidinium_carterae.2